MKSRASKTYYITDLNQLQVCNVISSYQCLILCKTSLYNTACFPWNSTNMIWLCKQIVHMTSVCCFKERQFFNISIPAYYEIIGDQKHFIFVHCWTSQKEKSVKLVTTNKNIVQYKKRPYFSIIINSSAAAMTQILFDNLEIFFASFKCALMNQQFQILMSQNPNSKTCIQAIHTKQRTSSMLQHVAQVKTFAAHLDWTGNLLGPCPWCPLWLWI